MADEHGPEKLARYQAGYDRAAEAHKRFSAACKGSTREAKLFAALDINTGKPMTSGELMATIADRLAQIKDAMMRYAVELRLFGYSATDQISGADDDTAT